MKGDRAPLPSGLVRNSARNLALLLGALMLGLLAAEGMVRLLAPQRPTPAFVFDSTDTLHELDPVLGRVMRRSITAPFVFGTQVHTNSLGLRDQEVGPKEATETRILSLGDSYAMGYGVEIEQSYGKLLERRLGSAFPSRRVSVISAGVDGYGTRQAIIAFERLRGTLQPDFVLGTFVAGNDVHDNAMFEQRLRTHLNTPLGVVGSNSHAVRLLLKASFPIWFFLANRSTENIDRTIDLLREQEGVLREAQVPCLMLIIPARHQIRPAVEPPVKALMRFGWGRRLVFRQNRAVIDHFRREGVPYLDTWPALVRADSQARVSFSNDSHLNAFGHEVVAREILATLQDSLLNPLVGSAHASCGRGR